MQEGYVPPKVVLVHPHPNGDGQSYPNGSQLPPVRALTYMDGDGLDHPAALQRQLLNSRLRTGERIRCCPRTEHSFCSRPGDC